MYSVIIIIIRNSPSNNYVAMVNSGLTSSVLKLAQSCLQMVSTTIMDYITCFYPTEALLQRVFDWGISNGV